MLLLISFLHIRAPQTANESRTYGLFSWQGLGALRLNFMALPTYGRGKSWMDQAEDSILQVCQLTELKQTKEWERYPNRFRRLYETLLPENLGKHCREWSAGKTQSEINLLIQENCKTARHHSVHWWLRHQRPVRVGLHCQARCDYHPWRQCSLYGLNLQLDNGGGSSHPCPLLDYLKRWKSDHTCHHPRRLNDIATKREKWNGKPRLECVDGRLHLRKLL